MSAQGLPWFRMYTDFLNDPKLISLAFEDQRHFIGVLALKCAGVLDQDCDPNLMDRIVAQRLWIDHAIIQIIKERLVAARLVDTNWQPLGWKKRQFRSDHDPTGAERQRRFREKKLCKPLHNADVTDVDTDADTETEEDKTEEEKPRKRSLSAKDLMAEGVNAQHAADWMTLREAKRQPLTLTAWQGVKAEAEKAGMTPAQAVEAAVQAGWAGFKAEWFQHNEPRKPGGTAWWFSPETKLAKAIEVGVGPARPGETDAAWQARIRATIDNGGSPSAPARPSQTVTARDPGALTNSKPVISLENRESFQEAIRHLRAAGQAKSARGS